jgi:hypothetical protein
MGQAGAVPLPLREQRHVNTTVTGYAGGSTGSRTCLQGAQQAADPVANAFTAATVRHVVSALTAYTLAGRAGCNFEAAAATPSLQS